MTLPLLLEGIGKSLLSIEPLLQMGVLLLKESYEYHNSKAALYDGYSLRKAHLQEVEAIRQSETTEAAHGLYYLNLAENCSNTSTTEDVVPVEEVVNYSPSVLREEEEMFFNSLLGTETVKAVETELEPQMIEEEEYLDFNNFTTDYPVSEELTNQTVLSIEKIDDYVMGMQQWTVEVVGQEQDFIHVSDGSSRTWLQVINQDVVNGDILELLVDRKSHDSVELISMDLLQRRSLDYQMADKFDYDEIYQEAI